MNKDFAATFFGVTTFVSAADQGEPGFGLGTVPNASYRRRHACWDFSSKYGGKHILVPLQCLTRVFLLLSLTYDSPLIPFFFFQLMSTD